MPVALGISVKLVPVVDDCHCTSPTLFDNVNVTLLPEHITGVVELIVPGSDTGSTVTVYTDVVTELHAPLVTTA